MARCPCCSGQGGDMVAQLRTAVTRCGVFTDHTSLASREGEIIQSVACCLQSDRQSPRCPEAISIPVMGKCDVFFWESGEFVFVPILFVFHRNAIGLSFPYTRSSAYWIPENIPFSYCLFRCTFTQPLTGSDDKFLQLFYRSFTIFL